MKRSTYGIDAWVCRWCAHDIRLNQDGVYQDDRQRETCGDSPLRHHAPVIPEPPRPLR